MMKLAQLALAGFLMALLPSCSGGDIPTALAPDTILYNAKIVTVDEDFSIAQALAIKDGRLVAVGSDSQVLALAGESADQIDLEGKTVLPGFYDSHIHIAGAAGEAPDPLSNQMRKRPPLQKWWNWFARKWPPLLRERWCVLPRARDAPSSWRKTAGPTAGILIPSPPTMRSSSTESPPTMYGSPTVKA